MVQVNGASWQEQTRHATNTIEAQSGLQVEFQMEVRGNGSGTFKEAFVIYFYYLICHFPDHISSI